MVKNYTTEELAAASEIGFTKDTLVDLGKPGIDNAAMRSFWDQVDAILGGIKTMRQGGEAYLPKFPQEADDDYTFRKTYTKMTNVYADILGSLTSKPFEKDVKIQDGENNTKPPVDITTFAEDVDGAGNNLHVFASQYFFHGVNNAIDWIFVDYLDTKKQPVTPGARPLTRAEEKQAGIRPYWTRILARNMLDIATERVGGKVSLSLVRIYEPKIARKNACVRIIYRFLGLIKYQLWEDITNGGSSVKEYALIDSGTFSIDVIPCVPFITGRRDGETWQFDPPLRDAADLQVNLYCEESNLEFLKVKTAFPMIAANGIRPDMDKATDKPKPVKLGPNAVLYAPPNADGSHGTWAPLPADASTLTYLETSIEKSIQQLREIGKQPLTAQSGNLTVITTAVAAGKAKSAVAAWAFELKDALENALIITAKWLKETYDPEIFVNTDIEGYEDNADAVGTLNTMRANRDLSQLTYWEEMQRYRVLSESFDAATEEQRLADEASGIDDMNVDPNIP